MKKFLFANATTIRRGTNHVNHANILETHRVSIHDTILTAKDLEICNKYAAWLNFSIAAF